MRMTMWRVLTLIAATALFVGAESGGVAAQQAGVEVHGHWTVEIRNPDGSLASHHEFDNALIVTNATMTGNGLIAGLLSRRWSSVGEWWIRLSGTNGPCGTIATPAPCDIIEATWPGSANAQYFKNLTVDAPTKTVTFPAIGSREIPTGTMTLSGQATAAQGAIEAVSTRVILCPPGSNCFVGVAEFTWHTLATPITVSAGQIIQVSVAFSFS